MHRWRCSDSRTSKSGRIQRQMQQFRWFALFESSSDSLSYNSICVGTKRTKRIIFNSYLWVCIWKVHHRRSGAQRLERSPAPSQQYWHSSQSAYQLETSTSLKIVIDARLDSMPDIVYLLAVFVLRTSLADRMSKCHSKWKHLPFHLAIPWHVYINLHLLLIISLVQPVHYMF